MTDPGKEDGIETDQHESAPDSSDATITAENLELSFGDLAVLEDVSLSVDAGEFVGLVGPNGSGKTTLLRAISGALEPDSGAVTIEDIDVHEASSCASSRRVAVVPQDTTLSFSFPVRDVVEMGRYPYRSRFSSPTPDDRTTVERALERTQTASLSDRPIDELSGGQRQRVVLARAIAQDTPALLLDEPTASLDVNHGIETLELVRELVADGRTVVAAIHDLNLAARYCDRLVMLSGGRVHRDGSPSEVLSAEALRTAFDANAVITENAVTGTPTVTALPQEAVSGPLPDGVHVLGSDATASGILARLDAAGVETSLGPVPSGAGAAETAARLEVDRLEVEPFAPLSREHWDALDRHLCEQDVVVLADLEVGAGNQVVLDQLLECESIVVVESRSFAERNFAGEGARERYEAIRDRAVETSSERVLETVSAVCRSESGSPSDRSSTASDRDGTRSGVEESASSESIDD